MLDVDSKQNQPLDAFRYIESSEVRVLRPEGSLSLIEIFSLSVQSQLRHYNCNFSLLSLNITEV